MSVFDIDLLFMFIFSILKTPTFVSFYSYTMTSLIKEMHTNSRGESVFFFPQVYIYLRKLNLVYQIYDTKVYGL
jgi:hypothetical protein